MTESATLFYGTGEQAVYHLYSKVARLPCSSYISSYISEHPQTVQLYFHDDHALPIFLPLLLVCRDLHLLRTR